MCAGLKFWKVGSRKIFAVHVRDLKKAGHYTPDSSSSDVDELQEPPKKKFSPVVVSDIDKNIRALKGQLDSLLVVQGTLKIPLSFRKLVVESFKCLICHNIMKPPIIFARCCKRLIGCEECVDEWYRGGDNPQTLIKYCPQCRTERAYSESCRIYGIDDFLQGMRKIIVDNTSD